MHKISKMKIIILFGILLITPSGLSNTASTHSLHMMPIKINNTPAIIRAFLFLGLSFTFTPFKIHDVSSEKGVNISTS